MAPPKLLDWAACVGNDTIRGQHKTYIPLQTSSRLSRLIPFTGGVIRRECFQSIAIMFSHVSFSILFAFPSSFLHPSRGPNFNFKSFQLGLQEPMTNAETGR
jgi:hypothetical protein